MVRVNGNDLDVAGQSVSQYLDQANFNIGRIVVEINEEIVPKATYDETILNDGDIVEVISFVGGGWYFNSKINIERRI